MPYKLYYEGPRWGGTNVWHLKALYKVGKAGLRGKFAKLSPGRITKDLLASHLIMKAEPGKYILTYLGQLHFKQIKRKKI